MAIVSKIRLLINFFYVFWTKQKLLYVYFILFNFSLIFLTTLSFNYFILISIVFFLIPLIRLYNSDSHLQYKLFYNIFNLSSIVIFIAKSILIMLIIAIQTILLYLIYYFDDIKCYLNKVENF